MNLFKKLSTAETRRLAAFLESVACPPDTMSLMEVRGFLFAVCCAPVLSKPSEWIPEIFNHRPPNFATSEEEEFVNTALVRLYNQLMADVNEGTSALPSACKYKEPCSANFEKGAALHEWCKGFNEAHHLYFDHWEAGIAEDDELMAAVGFMVLTLGFFDDRDESRQMLDMAFDVDLPLHEMAPVVRSQMPQVMKEYARIGRAMYEEILEDEHVARPAAKGAAAPSNVVPFRVPHREEDARDRLLQAEELAIQALEETHHEKRVALARKALSLSDDCSRALSLLAEDAAESLEESAHYYHRAMEAARRTLGPAAFADAEAEGLFWGILETRPYMHAKIGYADTLWALERTGEALLEYEDMLRLNPSDNQGVRYVLAVRYLDVGALEKARALLDAYPEDGTWWCYNNALYWWMANGDCAEGRKARAAGLKANPYVLDYFTGKRRMPKSLPEFYAWGSTEEAVLYAHEARMTWRAKPGAVEWLQAGLAKAPSRSAAAKKTAANSASVKPASVKPAAPKTAAPKTAAPKTAVPKPEGADKKKNMVCKLFADADKSDAIKAVLADLKKAEASASGKTRKTAAPASSDTGASARKTSSKNVSAKDVTGKIAPAKAAQTKAATKTASANAASGKTAAAKNAAGKNASAKTDKAKASAGRTATGKGARSKPAPSGKSPGGRSGKKTP